MKQLTTLQIETLRQFIQEQGLHEVLSRFVAKADRADFEEWIAEE